MTSALPIPPGERRRSGNPLRAFFARLWYQAWSLVLNDLSSQEIDWLLWPNRHSDMLASRRVVLIVSRVRLLASLLAIMTPLWFVLDWLALPPEVLPGLTAVRAAATLGYVLVIIALGSARTLWDAFRALFFLMAIPTCFLMFSYFHLAAFEMVDHESSLLLGYDYMPFMLVAALSLFPLTALESFVFLAPMFLCQWLAVAFDVPVLDWPTVPASLWLLIMVSGVTMLAGIAQLAFLIAMMRESVRDRMTGCFTRHSAEELLEIQFGVAARSGQPLALAFIDLDHFKQVNDSFGHDAGDRVLQSAAAALRGKLRRGDTLARWGGEEFLLVMPSTNIDQGCIALNRIRAGGFGRRPDGVLITASMGLAERMQDQATGWRQLVETADSRMYQAKQQGRDRVVGCDEA